MKKLLALILGLSMAMATCASCSFLGGDSGNGDSSTSLESVEQEKTYTVTFKQIGEADVIIKVKEGESVAMADIPTPKAKEGYTVTWKATDVTKLTNIKENIVVEADLKANTYTITFDVGEDVTYIKTKDIIYNSDYAFADPTWEGYTFSCWLDENGKTVNKNGKWTIASDVTLTAKWDAVQAETVTVTFAQDGQAPIVYEIVKGSTFAETIPEIVGKTGYEVTWNTTDLAKLDGAINENVTINVTEKVKTYTVRFVDDKGIVTEPVTVTYGEAYDFTPNSAPEGYHFKGFTKDGAAFNAYSGTNWSLDESNITLTVVWEKDVVEEDSDDGNWTKNY